MTSVGSYEAKTHLPQLLDRVANGEKIVITKRGKPVAMLVPPEKIAKRSPQEVFQAIKHARENGGPTLGPDLTIRQLIEEGRRF